MIIVPILTAVLVGAFLGLRFKVFILVPASALGSAVMLGAGLAQGDSFWSILLTMFVATAAMQIGYLIVTMLARAHVRHESPGIVSVAQKAAH